MEGWGKSLSDLSSTPLQAALQAKQTLFKLIDFSWKASGVLEIFWGSYIGNPQLVAANVR